MTMKVPGNEEFTLEDGTPSQAWIKHHESVARAASGAVQSKAGVAQGTLSVDGANGTDRAMCWTTGGVLRWAITATNNTEGGTAGGSDLALRRYNNAGVFIDSPIIVSRPFGQVQINAFAVGVEFRHTGTLGFYGATPAAQITVTGSKAGNVALGSLMSALAAMGLIVNGTS